MHEHNGVRRGWWVGCFETLSGAQEGAHESGVLSLSERPKRTEAIAAAERRPPKTSSENGHAEQSRYGMYAQCLVATQLSDKLSADCTSQLTDPDRRGKEQTRSAPYSLVPQTRCS